MDLKQLNGRKTDKLKWKKISFCCVFIVMKGETCIEKLKNVFGFIHLPHSTKYKVQMNRWTFYRINHRQKKKYNIIQKSIFNCIFLVSLDFSYPFHLFLSLPSHLIQSIEKMVIHVWNGQRRFWIWIFIFKLLFTHSQIIRRWTFSSFLISIEWMNECAVWLCSLHFEEQFSWNC